MRILFCMTRDDESAREFWMRVDKILVSRKVMLKDIAAGAEIPYQSFTGWRTRHKFPDAQVLIKISQILHASAEYLVTGKEKDPDPPAYSDIIYSLSNATEEDLMLIRRILRIDSATYDGKKMPV